MHRFLLFAALFVFSLPSTGQSSIELLNVGFRYGFPSSVEAPPEGQKASEDALNATIRIPIKLGERWIWYNLISANKYHITSTVADSAGVLNNPDLTGFIFQSGGIYRLNDRQAVHLIFSPRYMVGTGMQSVYAWQMGGIALFEQRFHDRLLMRFGALYSGERFGPLLVPLVDLNWVSASGKWSISGLLPIYGRINRHLTTRTTVGLSFFGLVTSYSLDERFDQGYMERVSIDITGFVRYKVAGNWHAEARFGYALGRKYAQYGPDDQVPFRLSILKFGDNRPEPRNITVHDGLMAEFRVVYDLPLP